MEIEEKDKFIERLRTENSQLKDNYLKLEETISFLVRELATRNSEYIDSMNYILILDRGDFESKG